MRLPLLFLLCATGFFLNGVALVNSQERKPLTNRLVSESRGGFAEEEGVRGALRTTLATGDGRPDNACSASRHVQLEGRLIMESTNNIVRHSEDCCSQCQNRSDCDGWMFRASYHGCALYSKVRSVTECPDFDCEAGIIKEESLHHLTDFVEAPIERYRGLVTTCGQKELYEAITVVAAACSDVQRLCSPAAKRVEPEEFNLSDTLPKILWNENYFYEDYNNGFQEHTLTAEDCRMRCMRERRCFAWARTQPGQCWLKHIVPKEKRQILGDATGRRPPLKVQCGEPFKGVKYTTTDSDAEKKQTAKTPEECCIHCMNTEKGCVVWTFLEGICHMFLNEVGTRESDENATSGFIVTAPQKCEENPSQSDDEMMNIAAAYDVKCASILEYGPGKETEECSGPGEAKKIFDSTVAKLREVLSG